MSDPEPGNRRVGRAALIVGLLVLAIVVTIFVTFNIAHYRAMENETAANAAAPAASNSAGR